MKSRTMIYLEPAQLRALKARANKLGVSVAEVIRRMVDDQLERGTAAEPPPLEAFQQLVALGQSHREDVSERHDAYLGAGLSRDHVH